MISKNNSLSSCDHLKQIFMNSRLRGLPVSLAVAGERQWLFTSGEPWLLLTPQRLERLAHKLGLSDYRIEALFRLVRRWEPHPELYCRRFGLDEVLQYAPEDYPPAVCPSCDCVHTPHPEEAEAACPECAPGLEKNAVSPRIAEERRRDTEVRNWILRNDPFAFDDGALRPNWQYNKCRRLQRDWDSAVNRILLGQSYRAVAREFDCSVGVLHKKVKEARYWELN